MAKRGFEPGQKLFVLYDGRAKGGDADDAAVLATATSEPEGNEGFDEYDAVWYEYTIGADGVTAENEIMRSDLKV
jgi:hypothetical protein